LVKDNGRWLVASLHASTNLFDNVLLDWTKRTGLTAAGVCLLVGILAGWLVGRRRKPRRSHVLRREKVSEGESSLSRRAADWPNHATSKV